MKITSTSFAAGAMIPQKYTCQGSGTLPGFEISGVPSNAKSLAIIVQDPDAPTGDFVHWVTWNIDPNTTKITEGQEPAGVKGNNDAGKPGWLGPCPPTGTHHYEFHLYALDKTLNLPAGSDKKALRDAVKSSTIKEAVLIGLYKKS